MFSRNQKKFKGAFRSFSGLTKLLLGSFSVFMISLLLFTGFSTDNRGVGGSYRKQQYVELVDRPPVTINPTNVDGTANGLNLLLINNITTECYVKEYLQICAKSQDGTLTPNCSIKSTVERILGVSVCESGAYEKSNGMVLQSFLPWDDSKHAPKWDKSSGITLSNATSTSYTSGKIQRNNSSGVNATGDYVGPFQQGLSYFSINGVYKPSSMFGEGQLNNRNHADYMYFPDEVGGVNWEYEGHMSAIYLQFDKSTLTKDGLELLKTLYYAGSVPTANCPGKDKVERAKSANDLAEYCNELKSKYSSIAKSNKITDFQEFKWMSAAMVLLDGGSCSPMFKNLVTNNFFQKQSVEDFLKVCNIGKSVNDVVSNVNSDISKYDGNATGCVSVTHKGFVHYLVPESFGHYLGEIMVGSVMYARMLKFAGVNVDPTNPTTYMNQITQKSGQWVPSGNADWVNNEGIDKSQMNDKRFKMLNLAASVLGGPYKQADPIWPTKNADGTWNGYVDCSAYVEHCIKETMGFDISRVTWTQVNSPYLQEITYDQLKPGDLIYYYEGSNCEHVAFCLKPTGNGRCNVMHAANPRVGIKINNNYTQGTYQRYFRVKGIDN